MSVFDRLRKRRFYPIEIMGEVIHIRAMLDSELKTVSEFQMEDESIGYAIGCALLNEDQTPAFVQQPGETAKDFGARVLVELDLPSDTKAELPDKILKLSKGPLSADELKKN